MKKQKYFTELRVNGDGIVHVYNRRENFFKGTTSFVQLQIITNDGYAYVDLRDEQVDELIEALRKGKNVIR